MKNNLTYIIDDDKLTIKLMSILIAKNEFCKETQSFYNAELAIAMLKNSTKMATMLPDVILLDLNMPVMDGWQFLDEFAKLKLAKPIYIFIMTSSIDPADIEKATKYEFVQEYIKKPITVKKLKSLCELINNKN